MALIERTHDLTIASALAARATTDPARPYLLFGNETLHLRRRSTRRRRRSQPPSRTWAFRRATASPWCCRRARSSPSRCSPPASSARPWYPLNPAPHDRPSSSTCSGTPRRSAAVTIERHHDVGLSAALRRHDGAASRAPASRHGRRGGSLVRRPDLPVRGPAVGGGGARLRRQRRIDPESCFALLYTSGTSGKPKGVELSHTNLLSVAPEARRPLTGLTETDRVVGISALFHVYGLGPGLLGTLMAGGSMVLQDEGQCRGDPLRRAGARRDGALRHPDALRRGARRACSARPRATSRRCGSPSWLARR